MAQDCASTSMLFKYLTKYILDIPNYIGPLKYFLEKWPISVYTVKYLLSVTDYVQNGSDQVIV